MKQEKVEYMTDEEYEEIWVKFCNFRNKIISDLRTYNLFNKDIVLDLLAGHGLLSLALSKNGYKGKIIALGLKNDAESFQKTLKNYTYNHRQIQYLIMNSALMALQENSVDFIINFLGLEDINMTIGKQGIIQTLTECARILKKDGYIEMAILKKGNLPSSRINWEVWKYIGLNAIFYPKKFYVHLLKELNFKLEKEVLLQTKKKMTVKQAKEEIQFACNKAPAIFQKFTVKTRPFEEVWKKFKKCIENHGMGYYPDILILVFRKK